VSAGILQFQFVRLAQPRRYELRTVERDGSSRSLHPDRICFSVEELEKQIRRLHGQGVLSDAAKAWLLAEAARLD
jgi:hypothetical protein